MDHTQFRGHVEKKCVQILIIKEFPKQNFSYSTVQYIHLRPGHPKSFFHPIYNSIKLCCIGFQENAMKIFSAMKQNMKRLKGFKWCWKAL